MKRNSKGSFKRKSKNESDFLAIERLEFDSSRLNTKLSLILIEHSLSSAMQIVLDIPATKSISTVAGLDKKKMIHKPSTCSKNFQMLLDPTMLTRAWITLKGKNIGYNLNVRGRRRRRNILPLISFRESSFFLYYFYYILFLFYIIILLLFNIIEICLHNCCTIVNYLKSIEHLRE